jgi:hypothetical protein
MDNTQTLLAIAVVVLLYCIWCGRRDGLAMPALPPAAALAAAQKQLVMAQGDYERSRKYYEQVKITQRSRPAIVASAQAQMARAAASLTAAQKELNAATAAVAAAAKPPGLFSLAPGQSPSTTMPVRVKL